MVVAAAQTVSKTPSSSDLLIIGPGVLGSYLGKIWQEAMPGSTVIGQTNTVANHPRLKELGMIPRLKPKSDEAKRFPFVVFCAPPSGSEDYAQEVRDAAEAWDGTGTLLFTSSAGLYVADNGSACNEDSEVAVEGSSPRNDRLLQAERAVLGPGGCVVRLVGLYHARRGAHTFFLKMGRVPRWPGYTVNLIHYEDAASLCLTILKGKGNGEYYSSQIFLGCDSSPLTFQQMMDATVASGKFSGKAELIGEEGLSKGKRMSNDATRAELGWEPKYRSFQDFMGSHGAEDFYTQSGLFDLGAPHQG